MKKFLLNSKSFAIVLMIVNLFFAGTAFAKSTTWNIATGGLWTTAGNWSNGVPAAGDDVIINGASTAITAVPTISLANLTIGGTCNLVGSSSGNTITVTGSFSVAAGTTFSLGTNGSSRFNITLGSASVSSILGTVNVYSTGTSATFTNSGDLTLGSAAAIADGGGANNTDFSLSSTGILRIGSTAGISTTAGTGNIRVTGNRSYTSGSEIVYNGSAAQFTGNGIPTTSNITIDNVSGVALTAAFTSTGTLTITNGALDMANFNLSVAGLTGSGNLTHLTGTPGNRTLSVTGNISPAAFSGIISNGTATSVLLTKSGNGTLTLTGANSYSGATTISNGVLSVNSLADAGNFSSLGTGSTTPAVSIAGSGTLRYTGSGHSSDRVMNLTADGATIDASGSGTLTLTGGVTGAGNNLNLVGTGAGIESGVIATTTATVTKNGTGSWALTGLNTFSGAVTITSGTLIANTLANAGINSSLGTGSTTPTIAIAATGVLQYTGTGHSTSRVINVTADGGTIDASGSGTLTLSGGITGSNNNVNLVGSGNGIQNGIISTSSGTLTKSGSGTWQLGAANTFTGTTTINNGTLQYTVSNALATGAVTVNGGIFDIGTFSDAVGTVTLISGSITGTTGILTGTSYAVQSGSISAILAGAVTLTKTTSGTVTLSGTNTYTGTTTISAGTLIAANTQALGTVAGAVNLNGGVLNLATDVSVLAYNVIVGGNAEIISNRATPGVAITHSLGTLSIGNFTLTESVGPNVNSGIPGLSFGNTTLSANTPKFDIASGANLTLGALNTNSSFTKLGSGQLTLNTASARTNGTVTLSAGTMKLGNASALGTTGVPLQLNGGTLDLSTDASVNAYNTTVGGSVTVVSNRATSGAAITHTLGTLSIGNFQLTASYGANISSGTAGLVFGTTTLSANSPVFDVENNINLTLGSLSGNFSFTKQNNGRLILNTAANANRTTATVTLSAGTTQVGSTSAFGTAGVPLQLNGGNLVLATNTSVNAHNVTIGGNVSIFSDRATSGGGITHTLGTLSIGNFTMSSFIGVSGNINDGVAGLTFGATTFTANSPDFDVSNGGLNLTLGALSGNFSFIKNGGGQLTLNSASARTSGTATLTSGIMRLGNASALGTTTVPLQLNGGTLELATDASVNAYNTTVGGNTTISSNRATSGAGVTHTLGTLNIGTNILSTIKGANVISGTAAVQFGNLTMTGTPTLDPITANLIMAGTATGSFKLTKTGAGTLQKTTTAWTLGSDFEMTAGTYDGTTQNTTILGDWLNNGGTYTSSGSSTVIFNGSFGQSIGGSTTTAFNNLTIDNTSGVSLGNNETVNATLSLVNGNIIIPTGNTLTIANGNAVVGTGFGATKNIVTQINTGTGAKGFVRVNNMATSAAYLLPVGDGTNYLPVTLTPTDAPVNNSFSICAFQGITANGEPNGTPFTAAQKDNCVDAVWTVNYNGPGSPTAASTNMTVGWPASLEGINFSGYNDFIIGIAHYDGPTWGPVVGVGDNTNNTATRANITTFSPFGVGKIDPSGGVLAIKVIYFNAAKANGYNTLNWQASCSSAQATFELLRSADGINFVSINSITASQARCAQPFNYNDNTAPSGTVYYRLKMIDVDGKVAYSAIVKLSNQVKDIELSGIAPNPVVNIAQVKINTTKKDVVELAVVSADGKVVYRSSLQLQPGSSIVNVDISNLPSGVYMIKGIFSDGQTNTVKFIKQ